MVPCQNFIKDKGKKRSRKSMYSEREVDVVRPSIYEAEFGEGYRQSVEYVQEK